MRYHSFEHVLTLIITSAQSLELVLHSYTGTRFTHARSMALSAPVR
jgi:hypothetical protein